MLHFLQPIIYTLSVLLLILLLWLQLLYGPYMNFQYQMLVVVHLGVLGCLVLEKVAILMAVG
jgi:hypothetical protein